MKTRMSYVAAVCAAAGTLAFGPVGENACASILIDDFTTVHDPNPWPEELFLVSSATVSESMLNTLGGTRETYLEATTLGIPGVDSVRVDIATGPGLFGYFSSSEATGFVSLLYDGGGSLEADFSAYDSVQMNFAFFDFANGNPLPITVTMSDGTNDASHTVSLDGPGAQVAMFNFSDFSDIGMVDLTSIEWILFELDPRQAADFQIANLMVVPTPGAIALLGIAGLTGCRRRRA